VPRFMKITDDELRKLHAAGVTKPDIMRHYNIKNAETIRLRERAIGLPPRKPGCRPLGTPSVEDALNDRA
jgi:hypothetical protein